MGEMFDLWNKCESEVFLQIVGPTVSQKQVLSHARDAGLYLH